MWSRGGDPSPYRVLHSSTPANEFYYTGRYQSRPKVRDNHLFPVPFWGSSFLLLGSVMLSLTPSGRHHDGIRTSQLLLALIFGKRKQFNSYFHCTQVLHRSVILLYKDQSEVPYKESCPYSSACWSRGMILALGARGPGFKSRTGPIFFPFLVVDALWNEGDKASPRFLGRFLFLSALPALYIECRSLWKNKINARVKNH